MPPMAGGLMGLIAYGQQDRILMGLDSPRVRNPMSYINEPFSYKDNIYSTKNINLDTLLNEVKKFEIKIRDKNSNDNIKLMCMEIDCITININNNDPIELFGQSLYTLHMLMDEQLIKSYKNFHVINLTDINQTINLLNNKNTLNMSVTIKIKDNEKTNKYTDMALRRYNIPYDLRKLIHDKYKEQSHAFITPFEVRFVYHRT